MEGLPVARPGIRGHRIGVPASPAAVGHDDDEIATCGHVPNAQVVECPEVGIASVEQVEHRIAARGGIALGQEHVDGRIPPDGRRGEPVVLHAATVLVLHNVQARGLGRGRGAHGGAGAHSDEGGDPAHAFEHVASIDCSAARREGRGFGHRLVRSLIHGMYSSLLCH